MKRIVHWTECYIIQTLLIFYSQYRPDAQIDEFYMIFLAPL